MTTREQVAAAAAQAGYPVEVVEEEVGLFEVEHCYFRHRFSREGREMEVRLWWDGYPARQIVPLLINAIKVRVHKEIEYPKLVRKHREMGSAVCR